MNDRFSKTITSRSCFELQKTKATLHVHTVCSTMYSAQCVVVFKCWVHEAEPGLHMQFFLASVDAFFSSMEKPHISVTYWGLHVSNNISSVWCADVFGIFHLRWHYAWKMFNHWSLISAHLSLNDQSHSSNSTHRARHFTLKDGIFCTSKLAFCTNMIMVYEGSLRRLDGGYGALRVAGQVAVC